MNHLDEREEQEEPKNQTPWGIPDYVEWIAGGIVEVECPRHGGIIITEERFDEMPYPFRNFQPTFDRLHWEEDSDIWVLIAAFSEEFPSDRVAEACGLIRRFAKDDEDFRELLQFLPDATEE